MELQNLIIAESVNPSQLSTRELHEGMFIIHNLHLTRQQFVDEFVWNLGSNREEHAKYFDLTRHRLRAENFVIRRVLERHGYTEITPETTSARFGRFNPIRCIEAGNLRLFKARENTSYFDRTECMAAAAKHGHIEFMTYLASNRYPVNEDALFRAIEGDHIECFKYALGLGCDLDEDACEHIIINRAMRCFRHAVQCEIFVLPEDAYFEYFSSYSEEMTITLHMKGLINGPMLADAAIDADHTGGLRLLLSLGVRVNPASIENARSLRCLRLLHEEAKIPVSAELALIYADSDQDGDNHRKREERFKMLQYLVDKVNIGQAYYAAIDIGSPTIMAAILEVHPQPAITLCDDVWKVALQTNSLEKYRPLMNLACDYLEATMPDIILAITPMLMFFIAYCKRQRIIDRTKHLLTQEMKQHVLELAVKHNVWGVLEFVARTP